MLLYYYAIIIPHMIPAREALEHIHLESTAPRAFDKNMLANAASQLPDMQDISRVLHAGLPPQ